VYKRALLLTAATVALMSGPAFATDPNNTDITTKVTTPVATSTANSGAPADILIDTTGTVEVSGPTGSNPVVPAATIDSSNIITNKGTIDFDSVPGAIGVQLDSGNAGGPISGAFDNIGVINLTGGGTVKTGILITTPTGLSATFTGVPLPDAATPVTTPTAIDLESGSTLNVQGDSSTGIELASGTTLDGDILVGGTVTVSPTTTGEKTGTGGTGVELLGPMNGNFTIEEGGTIDAIGPNAQGVVINGILTGMFTNDGTIDVVGTATPTTANTNPSTGSALWVENNITGGIYNGGPDLDHVSAVSASISGSGLASAPTILISPLPTAVTPLVISPVIDPDSIPGDAGFSLLNRGTIEANAANADESTTAIRLAGASTLAPVNFTGGILDEGTISAAGSTTSASGASPIDVTAILIDTNANVPNIVTSVATGSGDISASASGTGEATVVAIEVNQVGSDAGSLKEIDNAGTISASAATTDLTVQNLAAYAILDNAGTITTINNTGTIEATATPLTNGLQIARAVDLSNSTSAITFTNNGTVIGDVLLGSGNDTFTVEGLSPTAGAATVTGNINLGGGADTLTIGGDDIQDIVTGKVQEQGAGSLVAVTINANATLNLKNDGDLTNQSVITSPNLPVSSMTVKGGGTLGLTVSQFFNTASSFYDGDAVVQLSGPGMISLAATSDMNVSFGGFVTASATQPAQFVLLAAPGGQLTLADESHIAQDIDGPSGNNIPFLFTGGVCTFNVAGSTDLCTGTEPISPTDSELVLNLTPKSATTLGLTGYAAKMFPLANAALANDNALGAAVINGVTSNATAQAVYSAFAPDVTGATRAEAISLTDQATGPVGARQRALRMYAGQDGDATLWGQEFAQRLQVGNQVAAAGYDDSGFGFVLGMDAGDPLDGRYGAAFTFFSGDADEKAPRDSKTTSQWYMLTGYTDWRGKGFFFDSQINVGYGNLDGKRFFDFGGVTREAEGQRAAALLSGGATAGVAMTSGGTVIMPQISVDALTMREEGYAESNNGATADDAADGFDLRLHQSYAQSLRAFTGLDIRQDLNLGDFFLQPEARLGYRYDFVDGADKLQAEFVCSTVTASATETPCAAAPFSITGPDPARGNFIAGGTIATTTGAWSIGLSYDYLRGVGGPTAKDTISQSGTLTLLGRI
jgi:hypothetical protein